MNAERERFEAKFPVPEGVAWGGNYFGMAVSGVYSAAARNYQVRWEAWQAAKSDQAEELAKAQARISVLEDALKDACKFRHALCGGSDVENEGGDPATWDEPLMRWNKALTATDDSAKVASPLSKECSDFNLFTSPPPARERLSDECLDNLWQLSNCNYRDFGRSVADRAQREPK